MESGPIVWLLPLEALPLGAATPTHRGQVR